MPVLSLPPLVYVITKNILPHSLTDCVLQVWSVGREGMATSRSSILRPVCEVRPCYHNRSTGVAGVSDVPRLCMAGMFIRDSSWRLHDLWQVRLYVTVLDVYMIYGRYVYTWQFLTSSWSMAGMFIRDSSWRLHDLWQVRLHVTVLDVYMIYGRYVYTWQL